MDTLQEFLFYYEKSPPTHVREKENPMLVDLRRKEWDPLVKQTYSVWVDGPRGRRKWHLSAFSRIIGGGAHLITLSFSTLP